MFPDFIHLSAGDVSLVLAQRGGASPPVLYWGKTLGELSLADVTAMHQASIPPISPNAPDVAPRVAILAEQAEGYQGRPAIEGSFHNGRGFSPHLEAMDFRVVTLNGAVETGQDDDVALVTNSPQAETEFSVHPADPCKGSFLQLGAAQVEFQLRNENDDLQVTLTVELTPEGLVRTKATLLNTSANEDEVFQLNGFNFVFPTPLRANEILDFAGRWGKERTPQRVPVTIGTHLRENRRGRTGADSAYVLHVGEAGFDFEHGAIWAVHAGFSGNHRHFVEKLYNGIQVIGAGEMLLPGEVLLPPGDSYESPWVYANFATGLDAVAHRFHQNLRARSNHVDVQRPVTLNVWEAVYFNHDFTRLKDLADRAAKLGVERYVLDDGWFGSRRNDLSGLGDWFVSDEVWPDGLEPLVEHVTGLGMQFGLWFEPEMVNPDSDLARNHPEWLMATGERLPVESRFQQVLNLAIPAAYNYILECMTRLLTDLDISYIKWDHNRDLIEAAFRETGQPAVHEQTLATYRLMAELKSRFPGLEIESCSSGGGRIDLGIMQLTDRVWVSDCIDPLERQDMNRWTAQLLPLEMMGSHIASGRNHTTGRLHDISFRGGTALFGHLGIEWDLAKATPEELKAVKGWIDLFKSYRELLFTGDLLRRDIAEGSLRLHGVMSPTRERGLFSLVSMFRSPVSPRGYFQIPGLDPERSYRVKPVVIGDLPSGLTAAEWFNVKRDGVPQSWLHPAMDEVRFKVTDGQPREDKAGEATANASTTSAQADSISAEDYPPPPVPGRVQPGDEFEGVVLKGSVLMNQGLQAPALNPEQLILLEVEAV